MRKIGERAGTRYQVVKPAVVIGPAHTADEKLRARMETAGRVTNTDYREAYSVDRVEARRALAGLVTNGVLEVRGARRGAHCVRGPAWAAFGRPRRS